MISRLLVDSNIIIDALVRRAPFDESARLLIALGMLGEFELWVSISQLTDIFYVLSEGGKRSWAEQAKHRMRELRRAVRVCSLGEREADAALASTWADFEDSCVHQAAVKMQVDAIITRNKKDFVLSSIRVLDCEELFALIEAQDHVSYAELAL